MTSEQTSSESTDSQAYYYIDDSVHYHRSQPNPTQNLIDLYNLTSIAGSVARLNEDGTKGVKLRKSFKSYVSDLPGKHSVVPKSRTISPIVFAPEREGAPIIIKRIDEQLLNNSINFQRTPDSGIPGFDTADLAIGDATQGTKRKQRRVNDEDVKRRRINV